jgi:hypothetical protein
LFFCFCFLEKYIAIVYFWDLTNNSCDMEQLDSNFGKYHERLSNLICFEKVPSHCTFLQPEVQ